MSFVFEERGLKVAGYFSFLVGNLHFYAFEEIRSTSRIQTAMLGQ